MRLSSSTVLVTRVPCFEGIGCLVVIGQMARVHSVPAARYLQKERCRSFCLELRVLTRQ